MKSSIISRGRGGQERFSRIYGEVDESPCRWPRWPLAAFQGKQRPGATFYNHPLYAPAYTMRRFFQNERALLEGVFYLHPGAMNTTKVILFYAALFAIAAWSRRKSMWFAAFFALLAPLPIIFIPARGFFVMYIPLIGFALFFAGLLIEGRDRIVQRITAPVKAQDFAWAPIRVFTVIALALLIPLGRNHDQATTIAPLDPAFEYISRTREDLLRLNEPLPPGARVLLLKCRYPDWNWGPLMMMQLLYRDPNLQVDRPAMMSAPPVEASFAKYDRVLDFDGQKLIVVRRTSLSSSAEGRVAGSVNRSPR